MSVITPAFNAEPTIVQSVTSALAQTVANLELIVVDDGSTEPVAPTLKALGDKRVRVIRTATNRGVAAARNTALAAAQAPVVAQLDADDLWHPSHLEGLLPAFADPQVGLAYANADVLGHPRGLDRWIGERVTEDGTRRCVVDWQAHPVTDVTDLYRGNPIPAAAVTMRTAAARAAGGYPEWLSIGEDYLLYIRLLRGGWRFSFLDERSAVYRWPEPGRGSTFSPRKRARQQAKLFAKLALESPSEPGIWVRLAQELADIAATHVPASVAVGRMLRGWRDRARAPIKRGHGQSGRPRAPK